MTEFSQPWSGILTGDAGAYSDDQWSDMFRAWFTGGIANSGVFKFIDNQLEVSISATGPPDTIQVNTGAAMVDGKYYTNDAVVTEAVPAGAAGTYLAVLSKVWATQTVRVDIRIGATLTQTDGVQWEIPLAQFEVDGAGNVTVMVDLRRFIMPSPLAPIQSNDKNLFKNFPSLELTDDALPEWFEVTGTPTLQEVDCAGEGITGLADALGFGRALHHAQGGTGGSSNYSFQRFVIADELELEESSTRISLEIPVWVVDAGTMTIEIFDVGGAASLATVTTTIIGQLVMLHINDIEIGTTSFDIRFYHSAVDGEFYFSRPSLNVGGLSQPWKPRWIRWAEKPVNAILNENPADANWADLDFTANTTGLTCALSLTFNGVTSAGVAGGYVRINGSAAAQDNGSSIMNVSTVNLLQHSSFILCDDGQIIEESVGAATVTSWIISMRGYYEWE